MSHVWLHKKHHIKTFIIILSSSLLLIAILVIALLSNTGDEKLQQRLKSLQAQGHPITLEELNNAYTIPNDVNNAADIYMEAFAQLVDWEEEKEHELPIFGWNKLPPRSISIPESKHALILEYLGDHKETLNLLHQATALPYCRYPIDFTQGNGFSGNIDYLSNIKTCSHLLALESLLHCNVPMKHILLF